VSKTVGEGVSGILNVICSYLLTFMFNPTKESTINYNYSYDHKEDRKGETEITILF
jgi:hypothetical protein